MRKSAGRYCYDFPRPAVTADVVVFSILEQELHTLLIQRGKEPFRGCWAVPGGFVDIDEPLETAARRELREETGIEAAALAQVGAFGNPRRDPRGRVISIAYLCLVNSAASAPRGGDDAVEAAWHPAHRPPPLAFDHAEITALAHRRLGQLLAFTTVGSSLLPRRFAPSVLRRIHEIILGERIPPRPWQKHMLDRGIVKHLKDGSWSFALPEFA